MIKPKYLLILVLLLLVLVGAYYAVPTSRPNIVRNAQNAKTGEKLLPDFEAKKAHRVTLVRDGRKVELLMDESSGWKVSSHRNRPAEDEKVFTLIHSMDSARIDQVRTGKEEAVTFELDEKQRTSVTVFDEDNKKLAHLFVGKTAGNNKSFVMREAGNDVLETDQGIDNHLGLKYDQGPPFLSPAHWYELKILEGSRKDIIRFSIKQPDLKTEENAFTVSKFIPDKGPVKPETEDIADLEEDERSFGEAKKKTIWKVLAPQETSANEHICDTICASVLPLFVKGYEDDLKPETLQFEKPRAIFSFMLTDGTEHKLTFGQRVEDKFYFKLDDGDDIYRTGPELYNDLIKPLKVVQHGEQKKSPPRPR